MPWSYRDNLVIYILQSKYDMLSTQASALIQGKRARVTSTSIVNGQLTTIDDSLSARNLEMNAVLGKIASTTQELAHFHSGNDFWILTSWWQKRENPNVHGLILMTSQIPRLSKTTTSTRIRIAKASFHIWNE
ncbi:hypothetical protein LXL04_035600 [Taraxacum kok-saghyz]